MLCRSHVPPSEDSLARQVKALTKDQGKVNANVGDDYTHIDEANFVSCRSISNEIGQTHLQGKEKQDSTLVESLDSEGKW